MPPEMAVSMRHTKLKAEEAALLAGELKKPSWQSKNEGIHERVSFEDCIWGFDLAGGAYYKTPLRVTFVKPDSRAEKAGIRPGDKLLRINDIDTSTLTIQEAHQIILDSGIHLKIAVTAPEDEEDAYFCYEDEIVDGYDSEEERRKEEEKAKKRRVHAKVRSDWSLQWPWVSKRRIVYRESNCFMVPSKYEGKHRDKFPPLPTIRYTDDGFIRNRVNMKDNPVDTNESEHMVNKNELIPKANEPAVNDNKSKKTQIQPVINTNNKVNGLNAISEENDLTNGDVDANSDDSIKDTATNSSENSVMEMDSRSENQVLNEVLNGEKIPKDEEDSIISGILNDEENPKSGEER